MQATEAARYRVGADIGGTFTDIVLMDGAGAIHSKKVLSTPRDYSEAIEEGVASILAELGIDGSHVDEFVHATTIATNAIIERKGVKVALVTTRGFRDVLELGRFRTPRLYDITFRKPEPLVERRLRFEVDERTSASGQILSEPDTAQLDRLVAELLRQDLQAIAVVFINSYANPANERSVAAYLAERLPGVSVTASYQLLPQIGEYERTSTTTVNAYLRPVVERYVLQLKRRLDHLRIAAPLMIMQSSGGVSPGAAVAQRPINIIESGPAAGVLGGQQAARNAGFDDLIVFDMGGTTAKATIIEGGRFELCPETEVGGGAALGSRMIKGGGYPVQVPTIDIAEVGAGGGSIASIDVAGGIHVGPRSAGAEPGPICYNRGGTEVTVTDANLILGYLNPRALVGGELKLNQGAAEAAISQMAQVLGVSTVDAAYGVHLIANATMLRALRGVSSERGMDPSEFLLLAMGGNGPVHACTLAEAAGMRKILIPPVAGLFSALGMLFADVEHHHAVGFYQRFSQVGPAALNAAAAGLVNKGRQLLAAEGFPEAARQSIVVKADVKYADQTSPLAITLATYPADETSFAQLSADFAAAHLKTFGHVSEGEPLQFVALKVICRGLSEKPRMPAQITRMSDKSATGSTATVTRRAWFGEDDGWHETPVLARADLRGTPLAGPLIIEEYDTTIVVRCGWDAILDERNNVMLSLQRPAAEAA